MVTTSRYWCKQDYRPRSAWSFPKHADSARVPAPQAGDFADASRYLAPLVSCRGREPLATSAPCLPIAKTPPGCSPRARLDDTAWAAEVGGLAQPASKESD